MQSLKHFLFHFYFDRFLKTFINLTSAINNSKVSNNVSINIRWNFIIIIVRKSHEPRSGFQEEKDFVLATHESKCDHGRRKMKCLSK